MQYDKFTNTKIANQSRETNRLKYMSNFFAHNKVTFTLWAHFSDIK